VKDLVNEVERIVFAATQERASSNVASLHEVLQLTVDEIDRRAQRAGDEPEGVLTGLPDLDRKVFAFGPGQLVIIAARPGQGKTSLAGNVIANAVSKQGKTVLFFSLEMLRTEIGTRLLAAEAMVDFSKIRRSDNLSTQEWDAIYQGAERLQSGGDLFIDDRSALTPYDIVSTARKLDTVLRAQGKRPLDMIVVDYIQIMRSGQSAESKAVEVGQISGALKSIAKDFKIPVVALAQLNREGARQGTEGRPQLIHLKDSGSIEQDADLVLLIHRNQSDQTDSRAATEAEIIVAKNRNGETGPVSVMWLGHLTSFTSAVRAGSYAADVVASFENDQPPQY
jgi:replicative DNA helicase